MNFFKFQNISKSKSARCAFQAFVTFWKILLVLLYRHVQKIKSTYDELDHLTNRAVAPGANVVGTTAQTFEYDLIGRLKSASDNNYADTTADDSKVEYEYDPMGRVFTEKQTIAATSHTVTHQYDYVNEKKTYYPGGKNLSFLHDGLNRVVGINDAQGFVAGYGYSATGRVACPYRKIDP